MPIFLGTIEIVKIFLGTTEITDAYLGTTPKYTSALPQTATPTIHTMSYNGLKDELYWYVRNNDALSAEIWSEALDNTPDISRGIIASGANTSRITYSSEFGDEIVYATALASGKTLSEYHSVGL